MKTEKPTPRRLLKESKKGSSYKSRDLTVGLILFVGVIVLALATSLAPIRALYEVVISRDFQVQPAEIAMLAVKAFAWSVLPVTVAAIVCMALSSFAQSKGVIATEALRIDFTKLNPVSGFKNLFGLKMVKNLLAAVLYSVVGFSFLVFAWLAWGDEILAQAKVSVSTSAYASHALGMQIVLSLIATLLPLVLLAGVLEYRLYIRQMRMDKSEVKQEHKDNEGNPEIKQRRRERAEELSAQVQADVAGSSVILANPTHIAVGIFAQEAGDVTWPFVSVHEKAMDTTDWGPAIEHVAATAAKGNRQDTLRALGDYLPTFSPGESRRAAGV